MKLNRVTWTTFFILALAGLFAWFKFTYPQVTIADLSIDRRQAETISENYLQNKLGIKTSNFRRASVFKTSNSANRFLQLALGHNGLTSFVRQYDFDLFYWQVRFFKTGSKEQYWLNISSATGEIIAFKHVIKNNAARRTIDRTEALVKAKALLKQRFDYDADDQYLRDDTIQYRDNRSDYSFSWQKNNPGITWNDDPDSGTGKLLISATVSGDEILVFKNNILRTPEQFRRAFDNTKEFSRNTRFFVSIVMFVLLLGGIYLILVRQNHLAMHTTKKFYITLVAVAAVLLVAVSFNQFESILIKYKTTVAFNAYIWRAVLSFFISAASVSALIFIPGLAGELLHYETAANEKEGSFLHYARSTFASRQTAACIILGYLAFPILLGMQSLLITLGQNYLGVWTQHKFMGNISTAYWPFLTALTFGFNTSIPEEIMYRLFIISASRKVLGKIFPGRRRANIMIAVVLSSILWGLAHTASPVYPMWFRAVEVTCLGLFLGFVFIRFGIIPTIVSHYLFNVFWNNASYIFGTSKPLYFYGAIAVLLLPLGLAVVAFLMNREERERPLRWMLNKHQQYNLEILKAHINHSDRLKGLPARAIKEEITSHGWDPAVVDMALEEIKP